MSTNSGTQLSYYRSLSNMRIEILQHSSVLNLFIQQGEHTNSSIVKIIGCLIIPFSFAPLIDVNVEKCDGKISNCTYRYKQNFRFLVWYLMLQEVFSNQSFCGLNFRIWRRNPYLCWNSIYLKFFSNFITQIFKKLNLLYEF